MTIHRWGEKFDWESLNKAMEMIQERVKEQGNLPVLLKEKYGTIRYEHSYLLTIPQIKILKGIVLDVSDEFPHIRNEILEDLYDIFNDFNSDMK